jgi:hypothetical protein
MFKIAAASALALALSVTCSYAQAEGNVPAPTFSPEDAILDTGIPFAQGATQKTQELRGSFGWPVYQEGQVRGIFYRFDPDGFARFSPEAKLDSNVFEVTCIQRTYSCSAVRGPLLLGLDAGLMATIQISDIREGDRFFLVEGATSIEIMAADLANLRQENEAPMDSNGNLRILRGEDLVADIPLVGFGVTLAYLRWTASGQSSMALPADWPQAMPAMPVSPNLIGTGQVAAATGWINAANAPGQPQRWQGASGVGGVAAIQAPTALMPNTSMSLNMPAYAQPYAIAAQPYADPGLQALNARIDVITQLLGGMAGCQPGQLGCINPGLLPLQTGGQQPRFAPVQGAMGTASGGGWAGASSGIADQQIGMNVPGQTAMGVWSSPQPEAIVPLKSLTIPATTVELLTVVIAEDPDVQAAVTNVILAMAKSVCRPIGVQAARPPAPATSTPKAAKPTPTNAAPSASATGQVLCVISPVRTVTENKGDSKAAPAKPATKAASDGNAKPSTEKATSP